eukprot:TRINITY_DN10342_c2_g1_i1.p1 TRINITY_DN10342_c2_g1~~TRINITY_DN10342_c2_g1_i1.p1  ORF type:complete len:262 (+),score=38.68 TRINITY_DN10342_c2_g1_i1:64-849(+)
MVRLTGDAWPPEEGIKVDIPLDIALSECLEIFSEALLLDDAVVDYDIWSIDPPVHYDEIDNPFELEDRRVSQVTYDRSLIEQGLLKSDCVLYFTKSQRTSASTAMPAEVSRPSTPATQIITQPVGSGDLSFDTPTARLEKLHSLRQVSVLMDSRSTDGITSSTVSSCTTITRADELAASLSCRQQQQQVTVHNINRLNSADLSIADSFVPHIHEFKRPLHFVNKKPSPLCPVSRCGSSTSPPTFSADREASCGLCATCEIM